MQALCSLETKLGSWYYRETMNGIFKRLLKLLVVLLFLATIFFAFSKQVHADPPDEVDFQETFVKGQVTQIVKEGMQIFDSTKSYNETLKVQLLEGKEQGKVVIIGYSADGTFGSSQKINQGDTV